MAVVFEFGNMFVLVLIADDVVGVGVDVGMVVVMVMRER